MDTFSVNFLSEVDTPPISPIFFVSFEDSYESPPCSPSSPQSPCSSYSTSSSDFSPSPQAPSIPSPFSYDSTMASPNQLALAGPQFGISSVLLDNTSTRVVSEAQKQWDIIRFNAEWLRQQLSSDVGLFVCCKWCAYSHGRKVGHLACGNFICTNASKKARKNGREVCPECLQPICWFCPGCQKVFCGTYRSRHIVKCKAKY